MLTLLLFQSPAFEVATVKPTSETKVLADLMSYPGGRVIARRCTVEHFLWTALKLQPYQIVGGPVWIRQDQYDIDARPSASSVTSKQTAGRAFLNEEQKTMLLALLVDRFQLKYHRETRQGPVYFLTRTNRNLKLDEPKDKAARPAVGGISGGMIQADGIVGINASMETLALSLTRYLERPVINRTELKESYDFRFEFTPEDANPDVVASILYSVQQLGLKLESGKGPVETIVIDSVQRPAGN